MRLFFILIAIIASLVPNTQRVNGSYDVYNNEGLHLFINDNGTPTDYSDDWVYDWEDNRITTIISWDKN